MIKKADFPVCPVATTVGLIGNKWKLLIIRNLLEGTCRFGELKKGVEGISQKVLTDNLRELEKHQLVIRTVYAEVPPKVEYCLSPLGKTLQPIIEDMADWGHNYHRIMTQSQLSELADDLSSATRPPHKAQ